MSLIGGVITWKLIIIVKTTIESEFIVLELTDNETWVAKKFISKYYVENKINIIRLLWLPNDKSYYKE